MAVETQQSIFSELADFNTRERVAYREALIKLELYPCFPD
jgi:hypothetical protein